MTLGLTGGIGSGKSTIARVFGLLGCPVFNSDLVAKQVYFEPEVRRKVVALLGAGAYSDATSLNRTFISEKVFSDKHLLSELNAIIHPAVINQTKAFTLLHPGKVIIKESALLFEAHLTKSVDKVIVVTAPDELRISRVMHRDNVSRQQALGRLNSQLNQEKKAAAADYVIVNDEQHLVIPQVLEIYRKVTL